MIIKNSYKNADKKGPLVFTNHFKMLLGHVKCCHVTSKNLIFPGANTISIIGNHNQCYKLKISEEI